MAGRGQETTTKFKVDITELKKGIQDANQIIRLANSQFKAASAGMDDWAKSTDGVQAKINQLNKVVEAERSKLDLLKKQHALVVAEQGENSKAAQDLMVKINNQQAAVTKAEKSVADYEDKLEGLRKEEERNASASEKLSKAIKDQEGDLEGLKKKYQDVIMEQGKHSAEAKSLAKEIKDLSGDLQDNRETLAKAENAADKFDKTLGDVEMSSSSAGEGFTVLKGALANLVADGFRKAIDAANEFIKTSVDVGKTFDSSMSQVGAVSGASGDDLEKLRDKAKEMGENTKFSASEAADAFNYMAMAGWKTEDMLSGIEGVLNLAASSNTDLATTSDIVTDALTAMGYAAGDSGRLADVMAAASSNANTNVQLMGETFKYVAPVAGALGYSMEDVATAIGLMANSGIKGSQAGTALRSTFSRLAAPPKEAATAMGALGLSITDTDGNMKSLSKMMDDLRGAFSGLSEAEATQYAKQLAGQEAMSGLLAIVNAAPSDYEKLSNAVNNSKDAAADMAATMQDNLGGDLTTFGSLIESVQITLYEGLEPALRDTVESIKDFIKNLDWGSVAKKAGDALKSVVDFLKWIMDNANTVAAGIIAIGVGMMVMNVANMIFGLVKAFKAFKLAQEGATLAQWLLNAAMNANPIGIVISIIAALVAGFIYLWNTSDEFRQFWIDLWEKIKEAAGVAVDWLKGVWESVKKFFSETIPKAFQEFLDKVAGFIGGIVQWFQSLPGKIYDFIVEILAHIVAWGVKLMNFVTYDIPEFIRGVIEWFRQLPGKIKEWLSNAWQRTKEWGENMIRTGKEKISAFIERVIEFLKELPGKMKEKFTEAVEKAIEWGKSLGEKGKEAIHSLIEKIVETAKAIPEKMKEIGKNLVEGFWEGIKNLGGWIGEKVSGFFNDIVGRAMNILDEHSPSKVFMEIGSNVVKGFNGGMDDEKTSAMNTTGRIFRDVVNRGRTAVAGSMGNIKNRMRGEMPGVDSAEAAGITYNFYQTNNSPKALSRLEIYRQSKNLLNLKGVAR